MPSLFLTSLPNIAVSNVSRQRFLAAAVPLLQRLVVYHLPSRAHPSHAPERLFSRPSSGMLDYPSSEDTGVVRGGSSFLPGETGLLIIYVGALADRLNPSGYCSSILITHGGAGYSRQPAESSMRRSLSSLPEGTVGLGTPLRAPLPRTQTAFRRPSGNSAS